MRRLNTDVFRGLTYEAASRKGQELVEEAAKFGAWTPYLDALIALRETMRLSPKSDAGRA